MFDHNWEGPETQNKNSSKKCEVKDCETNRKVIGTCSYRACCTGKCKRQFCSEHDGKHYLDFNSSGKVCVVCAVRIRKCKTVCLGIGASILILSLLLAVLAVLVFRD